jgi:phenylalanyl-tRNA synthetase beta subunit
MGALKSSNLKEYDLNNKLIYCLSINLDMLIGLYQRPKIQFQSINKLMPIVKDISFFISPNINIFHAIKVIEELSFIQHYEFIDHYIKDDNYISYTIRFTFINTQNLQTKEIDQYINKVISILSENGCVVRK